MTTATKEKPILFSGPMIRALRVGLKTVTRRIVIPQPPTVEQVKALAGDEYTIIQHPDDASLFVVAGSVHHVRVMMNREPVWKCPYGSAGTKLWVRESCWLRPELTRKMLREGADTWPPVIYAADQTETDREWTKEHGWIRRNSIHMPRVACRIVLEVEDVRVERLTEITEADAQAEGASRPVLSAEYIEGVGRVHPMTGSYLDGFRELWETLNGPRGFGWQSNPFVWRVQFKVVEGLA